MHSSTLLGASTSSPPLTQRNLPQTSERLRTPRSNSNTYLPRYCLLYGYYSARLRPVPSLSHDQPQWLHYQFARGLYCTDEGIQQCWRPLCPTGYAPMNRLNARLLAPARRGGNRALSTRVFEPSDSDSEPTSTARIQFGHSPRLPSRGHETKIVSLRTMAKETAVVFVLNL
ncbi:hypothetical protein BDP81DRAFT_86643 [Colletotrichum phormii]|uniref:Uncharacterized protein n=1 Tax=Colletotrichum phormii TaxID=359342 RepID=A0AAJ0A233_9PEZI|nr:uncharacterized protein BDP81DRAFT_86643 [Colletotrichum phormii]KAK1654659.1 hypothetical protein BDP81DRAFT_86643 [Colletotrichum phormii]